MSEAQTSPRTVTDAEAAAIDAFMMPPESCTPLSRLGDFGWASSAMATISCPTICTGSRALPQPLDRRHNPKRPALSLPERWRGQA